MKPRLLLAEDETSIREMLNCVLKLTRDYDIIGCVGEGRRALEICETLRPTVLVADLRLPGLGGISLLQEIRRMKLGIPTVFYTGAIDVQLLHSAMEADPEGFVLKTDTLADLRLAVQAVCSGARYWAPEVRSIQEGRIARDRGMGALTATEREVVRLLAEGKSTKQMAALLHKSEHTVSHQRQSIMDKLGIHSAIELASWARDVGFGR